MNELTTMIETGLVTSQTARTFKNKKLASQTKAIEKLMMASKRNLFEISARLSLIQNEKLYETDGYKDVFEYAYQVLGYKQNTVYKMISVAEKFIEQTPDGKSYISVISHDDTDYTVSQLIELNTLDNDDVIALDKNEVVTPDMTTKEIREVVKDYKKGVIDIEGNSLVEETETDSDDETETVEDGSVEDNEVDALEMELVSSITSIQNIINEVLGGDNRLTKDELNKMKEIVGWLSEITL